MSITDTAHEAELLDEASLSARRRDLLARLDSDRERLEGLSAAAAELSFAGGAHDGDDDEGFGEGDPLGVERDHVLALVGRAQRGIEEAEAALDRLDNGSYGCCQARHHPGVLVSRLFPTPDIASPARAHLCFSSTEHWVHR